MAGEPSIATNFRFTIGTASFPFANRKDFQELLFLLIQYRGQITLSFETGDVELSRYESRWFHGRRNYDASIFICHLSPPLIYLFPPIPGAPLVLWNVTEHFQRFEMKKTRSYKYIFPLISTDFYSHVWQFIAYWKIPIVQALFNRLAILIFTANVLLISGKLIKLHGQSLVAVLFFIV